MIVEPLARGHSRANFDCGDEEVTRFLREKALQDAGRDLSRTSVLVDEQTDSQRIIGYYTLLLMQVAQEAMPNDKPRIKRPIPVVLLGQLGIDMTFQGRGYGDLLLTDVQARTDEIADKIGVRALMLDARNERLAQWYESHDFIRLPNQLRMFKSISTIRALKLFP